MGNFLFSIIPYVYENTLFHKENTKFTKHRVSIMLIKIQQINSLEPNTENQQYEIRTIFLQFGCQLTINCKEGGEGIDLN